ncbi:MAG: hypothetical protein DRP45_11670, partial [Candidatus Zixiibacteriota bacterium]
VEKNEICKEIGTAGILEPPYDEYGVPLGEVCFTPDGRWLVANGYHFLFTVDMASLTIVQHLNPGSLRRPRNLTCQNAP